MKKTIKNIIIAVVLLAILATAIFAFIKLNYTSQNTVSNNLFTDEYIKAGSGGKFGLIDSNGKTIMPFKYDDVVYDSKSQLSAVMLDGKWGFSDIKGNIVVNAEYDDVGLYGENNLAPVKKGDKWGYVNKSGKLSIECKFHSASRFSNAGIAVVEGDDRPYYINEKGEKILDTTYDMLDEFSKNGYAVVSSNEKFGVINKNGKVIVDLKYDREFSVDSEGFAVVSLEDKYAILNLKKGEITPFEYDFIMPTTVMYNSADIKSGFSKAYFIIFLNQLLESHNLFDENGIAIAVKNGRAGLINSKGKIVLEPKFDQLQIYNDSKVALVSDGDKYMYYDIKGNLLVNGEKFDKTNGFSNGLAVICKNSKWGYLDEKGNEVIKPQYSVAFGFSKNGLASVCKDDKWGYINKSGEFVIKPSYAYASTFVENVAKVHDGTSWKIIKSDGSTVCDKIISEPGLYADGYAVVESSNGSFSLYDLNGKLISKTKCDMIGSNHKSSKLCQANACYNDAAENTTYCEEHGVQ